MKTRQHERRVETKTTKNKVLGARRAVAKTSLGILLSGRNYMLINQ
jgi:hypothetical protein